MDSRNTVHEYSNEKAINVDLLWFKLCHVCYCVISMHGNEPRSDRHTCLNRHSESDLVQEILLLKRYSYFIYPYSGFYNFGLAAPGDWFLILWRMIFCWYFIISWFQIPYGNQKYRFTTTTSSSESPSFSLKLVRTHVFDRFADTTI
jgi:hypothetical protein